MKLLDVVGSLFFLILSIVISIESYHLKVGSYKMPGPGFMPFWIGVVIGLLSLLLFIQTLAKDKEEAEEKVPENKKWKNILLVLASLFIYTFTLERIGFVVSTFLFMVFLPRLIEVKKWHVIIMVASLTALGTYLLFAVWLKTQLPRGILM